MSIHKLFPPNKLNDDNNFGKTETKRVLVP